MNNEFMELPKGWEFTEIGEVCTLVNGKAFKPSDWVNDGIPIVRIQNLNDFNAKFNHFKGEIDPKFLIGDGELLFAWSGSFGAHIWQRGKAILNQHIYRVLFNEQFTNKFFFQYAINEKLYELIGKAHGGVGLRHVTKGKFEKTKIPLPPLNEQKRIVAKIEALQERSQRVKTELEAIRPLLDNFRQSVFAAAFRGDLTKDWREKHPDIEPASELLERIKVERKKLYEEECRKAQTLGERKPKMFKENLDKIEILTLPRLPKTWKWERFVNISNILGGVTKGRKLREKSTIFLPYLRVANVQDGYLDLSEIKKIEALPEDIQKYHLEYGDILVTEGGDRDKLGRGTIWRNEIENCIHQNHVYRARLYSVNIFSEYISLALRSEESRKYFFENASQTTNLASINITSLGNVPLAIPPLKEQKEIVKRIESLFKIADTIEQQYQKAETDLETLNQSILAKAFRGELVPQDSNDEPASVLLERIRAQQEANKKTYKQKKSTSTTKTTNSRKKRIL